MEEEGVVKNVTHNSWYMFARSCNFQFMLLPHDLAKLGRWYVIMGKRKCYLITPNNYSPRHK